MLVGPQPTRLCYSNNAIKRQVQREMICLQTDQSNIKLFFYVIVRLTGLEKTEILNGKTYNICTLTNKRRFEQIIFSTQSSAVQVADCCRKNTQRIRHYFKIELFEKTEHKNEN